jgi:hypothetical protein
MRFLDLEINWVDALYYLILPLTIIAYYIAILFGHINDNLFIYDGSGNIGIFIFLIPLFYFSIFRQPRLNRYAIVIATSISIIFIGKISVNIYILSYHTFTYGQSGVLYTLWGFLFINALNMLLNYKKEELETIVAIIALFVISAFPLIYPPFFFIVISGVAYQVHIISYVLGIIFGLFIQFALFEDNIYLKIKAFFNKG